MLHIEPEASAKKKMHRRKMSRLAKKEARDGYLFILPWFLGFVLFMLIPMITSLVISFHYWDIISDMRWAGLNNYINLFEDSDLPNAIKNTFVYTIVSVPLTTVFGLLIAMLMNSKIRCIGFFRTVFYLPSVLPSVAVAIVWVWLLNGEYGLINSLLRIFGIDGPMWLDDPHWAMAGIMLRVCWGVGGSMIMFLAALQNVPPSYYEAAEIDGAGPFRKFFSITLPMITPTIFYFVVTGFIDAMQEYVTIKMMTDGGPVGATTTFVLELYETAFEQYNMGYASAMAWVMFLVVLVLTIVLFKTSGWVYYESGDER